MSHHFVLRTTGQAYCKDTCNTQQPCLVEGVSFGLVLRNNEGEKLLNVPVERWGQLRIDIDVQQQSIRPFRLSERPELADA